MYIHIYIPIHTYIYFKNYKNIHMSYAGPGNGHVPQNTAIK